MCIYTAVTATHLYSHKGRYQLPGSGADGTASVSGPLLPGRLCVPWPPPINGSGGSAFPIATCDGEAGRCAVFRSTGPRRSIWAWLVHGRARQRGDAWISWCQETEVLTWCINWNIVKEVCKMRKKALPVLFVCFFFPLSILHWAEV